MSAHFSCMFYSFFICLLTSSPVLMHHLPFLSLCLPPYKSARCTSPLCFGLSHWDFTPTCWGGGAFSLLWQTPGVTRIAFQAITSKAELWEGNERREVREWEREGQRTFHPSLRRLPVTPPPPRGRIESDRVDMQPEAHHAQFGVRAVATVACSCAIISATIRQKPDTEHRWKLWPSDWYSKSQTPVTFSKHWLLNMICTFTYQSAARG